MRSTILLLMLALLTACVVESEAGICDAEDRDEPWVPGLLAEGVDSLLATTLDEVDPDPPGPGANAWTLTVLDGADAPVQDCELLVTPWMPDHGHGSSEATSTPGVEPGSYEVTDVDVTMVGFWTFGIDVDCGAAGIDEVEYRFCVEG
jgi:hypothetical protein